MASTRKKRNLNRKLLSQLNDFDQDIIIGNTVSERQGNATVNEGSGDQEFIVGISDNNSAANESLVNVKTLARCFNGKIDRKLGYSVDTVEDTIQNVILTAIDSIISPEIELAIRSTDASSERDATSVMASSERGKHIGITAPFQNVSVRNNTLHVFNTNDETRNDIPEEVSELSVPGTHYDRLPHTHHSPWVVIIKKWHLLHFHF